MGFFCQSGFKTQELQILSLYDTKRHFFQVCYNKEYGCGIVPRLFKSWLCFIADQVGTISTILSFISVNHVKENAMQGEN